MEVKINNDTLDEDQLKRYIDIAKTNNIGTLITISNQFTPYITDHPIQKLVRANSRFAVLHTSWRRLWTTSLKLRHELQNSRGHSADKLLKTRILEDFIAFIRDGGIGHQSFSRMPAEWKELCNNHKRTKDIVFTTCTESLIQEFTEITFILSEIAESNKFFELRGANTKSKDKLFRHINDNLLKKKAVKIDFGLSGVPDTFFAEIHVERRSIVVGMRVDTPKNRSTEKGKVNWLKRQLERNHHVYENSPDRYHVEVELRWWRKARVLTLPWEQFDTENIIEEQKTLFGNNKTPIISFTLKIKMDDSRKFCAPVGFISELEAMVKYFYQHYAWKLQNWQPHLPRPKQPNHY